MSVSHNQRRILLGILAKLRPHWRRDRNLPARLQPLLADRRFGSRDRRLYRELVYTALRILPWIEDADENTVVARIAGHCRATPDTRLFREAWSPAEPEPLPLNDLLPAWIGDECPAARHPAELAALLRRAPLWLRLQTDDPDAVLAEFNDRGWTPDPSPALPDAWRVDDDAAVDQTDAHRLGRVEIQDLGSQFILASQDIAPGGRWLDACAGAGGKTLQLARLLGPAGHVDAHDIRPAALAELRKRAERAGLANIATPDRLADSYDGVLVDAPCSGTGTWRRAPHLKWTTTPADLRAAARLQGELLARFAARVRPGGRLIYATCSLCRTENTAVAAAFAAAHPDFEIAPPARTFGFATDETGGLPILPARHDTDGFHVAAWIRRA
ncbi:MAG: RsmB/NOP family class I SAM-dependent RNA methyltransferase [Verrucomicrobiota bacterium]